MSQSRRTFVMRQPVVVDIGCSCRRAKISSFFTSFSSQPKPRLPNSPGPFSPSAATTATTSTASSHWETSLTATTSSPSRPLSPKRSSKSKGRGRKGRVGESVAVVKESEDPYLDFRESMLVMIVEKEIYAWEDLRDLLHRFLALNAPAHHHLILRAFAEIWASVFSTPAPSPSPSPRPPRRTHRR